MTVRTTSIFYHSTNTLTNTTLNIDLDPSKLPATTPFYRAEMYSNEYKFVVNTKPLFQNLPTHRNLEVSALSLDDLKSTS